MIGWWAKRRYGVWHLVESEIADRIVTRCGRQMAHTNTDGPLLFEYDPMTDQVRCQLCTGSLP